MIVESPRMLVINGYSNSGKTTFSRCLALRSNAELVDVDADGVDGSGLRAAWTLVERGDAGALLEEVRSRPRPLIMDWPYNPDDVTLGMVRALQSAGFPAWWFDADREAALRSCATRPDAQIHLSNFEQHSAAIERNRDVLSNLYGRRWRLTLCGEGRRPTCEQILETIRSVDPLPWLP